jgi:hypothetical protein
MIRAGGSSLLQTIAFLLAFSIVVMPCASSQAFQPKPKPTGVGELKSCLLQRSCTYQRKAALDLATLDQFQFLLKRYNDADEVTRGFIVEGIYGSTRGRNNDSVVKFMSSIAFHTDAKSQFSDTVWFALQFLAERCDERALNALNKGGGTPEQSYHYEVQCVDWATTLNVFGKCRYFKARKTLLNSLNSSCLDVMNSAQKSLHVLYPGQCMNLKTFDQATGCYEKLWARDQK